MNPVDLGLVTWVKGELEKFFSVDGQEKNQKDVSSCWWYRTIGKVVYQFLCMCTPLYPFNVFFLDSYILHLVWMAEILTT